MKILQVIVFTLLIVWLLGTHLIEAQPKKRWTYKGCYVRTCVTDYLNSLPSDVQVVISYDTDAALNAYDIWVQR